MRRGQIGWAALVAVAAGLSVAGIDFPATSDIVVSGNLRHQGLYQVGDAEPTTYEVTTLRYVVAAPPADVGFVVELDPATVDSLCRDKDGCQVTLQMINSDPTAPGEVVSRTSRLFVSESTNQFRFDDHTLAASFEPPFPLLPPIGHIIIKGIDGNGTETFWQLGDCQFTDGEASVVENVTDDALLGFGLLNLAGSTPADAPIGTFPDTDTTCRVVLSD